VTSPHSVRSVHVWDLPVRLFHWLAVALVAFEYATSRLGWIDWHLLGGRSLLTIVLFRIAWGFVGSESARFTSFVAPPGAALRHLRRILVREPDTRLGHNEAGGWMVVLMLTLLLAETVDGVLLNNDVSNDGPLTEVLPNWSLNLIASLHVWLWYALAVAITLHVAAVAIYGFAKGHRLVPAMVTGRKRVAGSIRAPRMAPLWLAPVLLALCAFAAEWFYRVA